MSKKILDIFKRDKTGFSNEELEWQIKWTHIMVKVWLVIIIALWIVTAKLTTPYTRAMDRETINFIAIGSAWICVVLFILVKHIFDKNSYNARKQLGENSERKEKEKILSYIKTRKFSKVRCKNQAILQICFQQELQDGSVEIIPDDDGIEISMNEDDNNLAIHVKISDLLDYFYLNEYVDE